jgi:tetratricopeptide (TPR) repeat protein
MSQDYYEILQVHPKADTDAIRAAYERLSGLYDPARLEGAADELISIARRKLAAIEDAYAVLTDPQQRASYDQSRALPEGAVATLERISTDTADVLDYRPLPPAKRAERARSFVHEPLAAGGVHSGSPATAAAIAAAVLFAVLGTTLLITNWGALTAPAQPQPAVTPTQSVLDQYETAIAQAKQATEQSPNDPEVWVALGNQLYDSAQIVRENMPTSTLYQQRLPRWLEASQAYERALALQPENVTALADKGTSLCYYGAGVGDQRFVDQGTSDVRNAASVRPDDPLIQLNLGSCLVSALPPQTEEAIVTWERVLQIAPVDSPLAARARELIDQYQKRP